MGNARWPGEVVLNSPLEPGRSHPGDRPDDVGLPPSYRSVQNRFALGMYAVGAALYVIGNLQAMLLRWLVAVFG